MLSDLPRGTELISTESKILEGSGVTGVEGGICQVPLQLIK